MSGDVHVRFCEGPGVRFPRATHLVIVLSRRDEAERVMGWLRQRLERQGLRLHPDKTRLVGFRRPLRRQEGGKGRQSFDFLGFTWYWRRSRRGHWVAACKTRRRLRRSPEVPPFCSPGVVLRGDGIWKRWCADGLDPATHPVADG